VELGGMSILVSIAEGHPTNIVETFKVQNDDVPDQAIPPCVKWLKEKKN